MKEADTTKKAHATKKGLSLRRAAGCALLSLAGLLAGCGAGAASADDGLLPAAEAFPAYFADSWEQISEEYMMSLPQGSLFLADLSGDEAPELFLCFSTGGGRQTGVAAYSLSGQTPAELGVALSEMCYTQEKGSGQKTYYLSPQADTPVSEEEYAAEKEQLLGSPLCSVPASVPFSFLEEGALAKALAEQQERWEQLGQKAH